MGPGVSERTAPHPVPCFCIQAIATFITDKCSATLLSSMLCWSPARGVYVRVECLQKADQERLIAKASPPWMNACV